MLFRAAWVLPIEQPPIRNGWVLVEDGRIAGVGGGQPPCRVSQVDLGRAAVLPGLVNAHTHLELSWMRGLVPPSARMPDWIRALMTLRRTARADPLRPIEHAIAEARASGTAVVGDVGNTRLSVAPLEAGPVAAVVFCELIAFNPEDSDRLVRETREETDRRAADGRVRLALAAHAPYSVAPGVFRAIAAARRGGMPRPTAVHLAESREEIEFLKTGEGEFRALLEELGAWDAGWVCPRCGPVAYLETLGFIDNRTLVVHGVHLSDDELARLAARGATLVTCPRSNRWTGAGTPPVARFYRSGLRIAVGTDSLASVEDLNVFSELHELRRLAPAIPAAAFLESATRHGADALGFGAEFGGLARGKRAELLAVEIPPGVDDVEEYLVSGVEPPQLRWVHAGM